MSTAIKLKLFDTSLPEPAYQTTGAAGFDLYTRETITITPRQVGKAPLNVAIELPPGHWAMLSARSSLYKKGVQLANGIGVMDPDYNGDNDEYQATLLNFTDSPVTIKRGERIVQLVILPFVRAELEMVTHLGNEDRGGFGSTGSQA